MKKDFKIRKWFHLFFFGILGLAFSFSWIVFGTFLLPQVLNQVDAGWFVRMFLSLGVAGGAIIISWVTMNEVMRRSFNGMS